MKKLTLFACAAAALLFVASCASTPPQKPTPEPTQPETAQTEAAQPEQPAVPAPEAELTQARALKDKIDSYQNTPIGLGYGHGRFDDKGNWHGLYALGFQDSHFKPEWMAGYGWKTYWPIIDGVNDMIGGAHSPLTESTSR